MPELRVLSATDVLRALPMARCLEVVRDATASLARGDIVVPERQQLATGDGVTLTMSALWPARDAMSTKLNSVYNQNAARGLPTFHGILALQELSTGRHTAIFEASSLTALRTSALIGLATDLLSRKDANTAAIIGAGRHARVQLEAILAVRALTEVRIYSRTSESARAFVEQLSKSDFTKGVTLRVAATSAEAAEDADVICCVTNSPTPVLHGKDVKPGTHVNAIGAFTPETRELDSELVRRARIVVDTRDGAREEAGDLLIPLGEGLIDASALDDEIGEVVLGTKPGRTSDDQITIFKSVGSAAFDVGAAVAALETAREQGLGNVISL
jgi:ornithine cyclodeaminase